MTQVGPILFDVDDIHTNTDTIIFNAIHGHYSHLPIHRLFAWMTGLKIVTREGNYSNWNDLLTPLRIRYQDLKQIFLPDVTAHNTDPLSVFAKIEIDPPLGRSRQSVELWEKFSQMNEIIGIIKKDISRLSFTGYPDDYFQNLEKEQLMINILIVWCNMHETTSYRQGMHELLGTIILVLERAYIHANNLSNEGRNSEFLKILNPSFLEADSFLMFEKLMNFMEVYYLTKPQGPPRDDGKDTPLIFICDRIQNQHLAAFDPVVKQKLESVSIQPQLYGIKWLRLLFGREFDIEDVFIIWDCVLTIHLATNSIPINTFIELFATTMVISIRDKLIESDTNECLHYLMRYSNNTPISRLLHSAFGLHPRITQLIKRLAKFPEQIHPNQIQPNTQSKQMKTSNELNEIPTNQMQDIVQSKKERTTPGLFSDKIDTRDTPKTSVGALISLNLDVESNISFPKDESLFRDKKSQVNIINHDSNALVQKSNKNTNRNENICTHEQSLQTNISKNASYVGKTGHDRSVQSFDRTVSTLKRRLEEIGVRDSQIHNEINNMERLFHSLSNQKVSEISQQKATQDSSSSNSTPLALDPLQMDLPFFDPLLGHPIR